MVEEGGIFGRGLILKAYARHFAEMDTLYSLHDHDEKTDVREIRHSVAMVGLRLKLRKRLGANAKL